MATDFWDHKCVVHADFFDRGDTVTAQHYYSAGTLDKIWQSIRRKMPRLICQGIKIF